MSFFSGNGGSMTIKKVDGFDVEYVLHLSRWEINSDARDDDVSTSAQGYSVFIGTLEHNEWSCEFPVDSDNTPSALELYPGAVVDISFKDGASSTYHKLTNTTVQSASPDNPNTGGAHKHTLRGHGGHLAPYAVGP